MWRIGHTPETGYTIVSHRQHQFLGHCAPVFHLLMVLLVRCNVECTLYLFRVTTSSRQILLWDLFWWVYSSDHFFSLSFSLTSCHFQHYISYINTAELEVLLCAVCLVCVVLTLSLCVSCLPTLSTLFGCLSHLLFSMEKLHWWVIFDEYNNGALLWLPILLTGSLGMSRLE